MAAIYIGSTLISTIDGSFPSKVVSSLPTASSGTMGVVFILAGSTTSTMYMTAESSGSYSWVQVGTISASIEAISNTEIDALFD